MVQTLFKWLSVFMLVVMPFAAGTAREVSVGLLHPMYVTVAEFNHNQKDQLLEISVKFFADDFEQALRARYKVDIDLTSTKDQEQVEKSISGYIQKHMQLKINGRPATMQWVGFEKEKESTWCYFQVNGIAKLGKLDVKSNLLYEMFSSQMAIMHVTAGGTRKSARLNNPEENTSFEF